MPDSDTADAANDVTVVVVAWDRYVSEFLPAALASLATQRPARVIVVDNASREAVEPDVGVVIRLDRRHSIGAARNRGLAAVTTPLVMFWDADDLMPTGTIARLQRAMAERPDLAAVASRIVGDDGVPIHWPRGSARRLSAWPRLFATVNAASSLFPTIGALLRTDALRAAGGFSDADEGDDWTAGASLAFRGRVEVLDLTGRIYRRHADSVSAGWRLPARLRATRHVRDRLRSEAASPRRRAAVGLLAPVQWFVVLVLRPVRLSLARIRLPSRGHQAGSGVLDRVSHLGVHVGADGRRSAVEEGQVDGVGVALEVRAGGL